MRETLKTEVEQNGSGYVSIMLDKKSYAAGDVVKGTVYIDLFKPAQARDIFIQFKGVQKLSKRFADFERSPSVIDHQNTSRRHTVQSKQQSLKVYEDHLDETLSKQLNVYSRRSSNAQGLQMN